MISHDDISLIQRVVTFAEEDGANQLAVAALLNDLAVLCNYEGQYVEAEPLYQRALVIEEEVFGQNSIKVAGTLVNLANLYNVQNQFAKAEPFYKRAIESYERTVGMDQLKVATVLNNLGGLYFRQARYAEAEPLLKHALVIYEETFGSRAGDVLDQLSALYRATNRAEEAVKLEERAATIRAVKRT